MFVVKGSVANRNPGCFIRCQVVLSRVIGSKKKSFDTQSVFRRSRIPHKLPLDFSFLGSHALSIEVTSYKLLNCMISSIIINSFIVTIDIYLVSQVSKIGSVETRLTYLGMLLVSYPAG